MKSIWIASTVAACWLAMPVAASAQGMSMRTDSLDPLARAIPAATPTFTSLQPVTRGASLPLTQAERDYRRYLREYDRYLEEYALYAEAMRNRTPGWVQTMDAISGGLALADQAVGVYAHYQEAKAIARAYRQQ